MGKVFGTDGVRGVANLYPMTSAFALDLAMACGELICKNKKKVAIAKDTRISSDMFEAALVSGFLAQGVEVIKLGVIPTPALTFLCPSLNVDMAVMITASHNPYKDNGIKLIASSGDKFSDEQTALVEEAIEKKNFALNPEKIGRVYDNHQAIEKYVEVVKSIADDEQALKGLRVVLDCANGCFSEIMPQVFKDLGAGVITLSNQPDGYNINKNCGSQHTEKMIETVINSKAHLGIAADGDGDRIIICDEKGNKIVGEQIIAFLAKYLLEQGKLKGGAVVSTIVANIGLEKYLETLGLKYERTAVGERYVISKMQEIGANVGGEESGHMVLLDYSKTGDALVVGLVIALGVLKLNKKMSEIFPLFEPWPCAEVDTYFESKDEIALVVKDEKLKAKTDEVTKKLEGLGYVIVRKSGTEPLVKVKIMGEHKEEIDELNAYIREAFAGYKTNRVKKVS